MKTLRNLIAILFLSLAACRTVETSPQPTLPVEDQIRPVQQSEDYVLSGLTENEVATLLSLTEIDAYPLYTMHYYASYDKLADLQPAYAYPLGANVSWACSLFAALSNPENQLYGRNFDWEYSPALLLFTDPSDGYASTTMVDIAYLGFTGDQSRNLSEKPLQELVSLLDAPYIPFDGINEAGLVIGMAAVPAGKVPTDPLKDTLGSLGIIRVVLDNAANVDEALEIFRSYNIDFGGGPPIHYLIADAGGNAALFEHYQGEVYVFHNQALWQQATNFLNASVESPFDQCWRYDTMEKRLAAVQGNLRPDEAMRLLQDVSQDSTQWSVVYNISLGDIHVVMGRNYGNEHVLSFERAVP